MKRLNIAMLSQQAQAEVEPVETQSELEVVGQQVEDSIAEATQIQSELEGTQQAMDDAEQVVQEVEEERQVLAQAQQQGGAEQPAMEALQRAMKRFEKRTGVSSSISSMGMESFASKSTRARSTKIAMEGAVEFIKKILKMLTDALASMAEKVKAFIKKMMVGAGRLSKRAQQAAANAKSYFGKKAPSDAVIELPSVLEFTQKDGKVIEGAEFVKEYEKQTANSEFEKYIADMMAWLKSDEVKTAFAKAYAELDATVVSMRTLKIAGKSQDGMATYTSPLMLGNYTGSLIVPDKSVTVEQLKVGYSSIKGGISSSENAKETSGKGVKPLTPEEAEKLAIAAAENMKRFKELEKTQKEMESFIKDIVSTSKDLEKQKDADVDSIRVASGTIRAIVSSALSMLTTTQSYNIRLTKAAVDYSASSINAIDSEVKQVKEQAA